MLRGRSVAAVAMGSTALWGLMVLLWRIQVSLPPPAEMPGPAVVLLGGVLMALVPQIPAGYLTAKVAGEHGLLHAAVVAAIGALGIAAFVADRGMTSFPWALALGVVQAPTILAGAWWAERRSTRAG